MLGNTFEFQPPNNPHVRRFNELFQKVTGIHPDDAKMNAQGDIFISFKDYARFTQDELKTMAVLTGPFSLSKCSGGYWIDTSSVY